MDVFHTIARKRDTRTFSDRELPADAIATILDAGRLAGSARNRQPWQFVTATDDAERSALAELVYVGPMIRSAPLSVAIVITTAGSVMGGFDGGRTAQNMMLSASELGIVSCPNGVPDPDRARRRLNLNDDQLLATVIAFGYPTRTRAVDRRTAQQWSAGARRRPLEEVVVATRQLLDGDDERHG